MLKEHLFNTLLSSFSFQATDDQKALFALFSEFVFTDAHNPVLIINGYAGTGKTSALATISKVLHGSGMPVELMASTGRAAKVLSSFCEKNAFTIHKKIYRQKSIKDGRGSFALNVNLTKGKIFIIDEASMISANNTESSIFGSGNLLEDLIEFVFSNENCRLVLSGDTAQLPPVGEGKSPALSPEILRSLGCTVFQSTLSQVTRQSLSSGILVNATNVRTSIEKSFGGIISLSLDGYNDVERIDGSDLQSAIETCYSKYGSDDTVIICRSNKIANKYNQFIRNRILYREEALSSGEKLLVVKNNYFWLPENDHTDFIANGDFVTLRRIKKVKEIHGFRFANCLLEFTDYQLEFDAMLLLESIESDGPGITREQSEQLFQSVSNDYAHIANKRKRYEKMLEDPYFNALQAKMGYAMTCHKSQGGQWKAVFVDFSFFGNDSQEPEVLKWLYTGITRATEKLYLVNFNDKYFVQDI